MATSAAFDSVAPWLARQLLSSMGDPPLRVILWDGRGIGAAEGKARGTVRIHDRLALARLIYDPEVEAGELYTSGRISFEGDLVELLRTAFRAGLSGGLLQRLLPKRLIERALRNDLARSRANAQHHYDVGNDFYALWLDERMLYTCAYFPSPTETLEDAQLAKLDHVCRKLLLGEGERVIEAGCGWGALALHMARYYGVSVRAFNVSHEQVVYAREQAEKQGLQDRVEFIEDDYRNISGRCDKFVSVGMLEHVGTAYYAELGDVIDRCLEPQGLGFIHTIGRSQPYPLNRWIAKRIFPNAHPPTLRQMMDIFEPRDFAVLDVESLRRHYALTLRHWLERFERSSDRIAELVGPERRRSWHLYLAGAVAAFEIGSLTLYQVLFTRAANDRIPWTRAHLHTGELPKLDGGEARNDGNV
jgi:cyclopropane-fatty-acyl-phospholipid synthase